jgi:hypothetical protein
MADLGENRNSSTGTYEYLYVGVYEPAGLKYQHSIGLVVS